MAAESIGDLIPTAIPGYADAADIQAALRVYHYGSYAYNPANTSPGSLVTPSMAKTIYDIQQDIVDLENRPSSGGDVANTAPVPGDFTPSGIPNGYIWVDQDGTIGGQPVSATSVFTNTPPTSELSTGVIWVDKDPTAITSNPFIPSAVISAKGDILIGTANDTASVLNAASTNGYLLSVNSATTSGLEWVTAPVGYSAPTLGTTTVTSGTTITNVNGLTINSTTIPTSATLLTSTSTASALTSFGTSPTIVTPVLTLSSTSSATSGRIAFDAAADKIIVGDGTNAVEFASSTLLTNAQTASYTLVAADKDKLVEMSVGSANNLTVPLNSSVPYPVGTQINILQTGAGQTTVVATGGVTINATPGLKLRAQWSSATLIKRGTDTWVLVGDLSA